LVAPISNAGNREDLNLTADQSVKRNKLKIDQKKTEVYSFAKLTKQLLQQQLRFNFI